MKARRTDRAMKLIFTVSALISIIFLVLIFIFILQGSLPALKEIGFFNFLRGKNWAPTDIPPEFGVYPMVLGSLYITLGSLLLGVPIGILTAIYLAFYAGDRLYGFLRPLIDLLAGIPSIIYGFFGLSLLVPLTRHLFGGNGSSILTASILLGIMIIPTIVSISEASLRAVDSSLFEGALALGASKDRAIKSVMLPAARSGVLSSVVLGLGRAVGETMAVIMVAGNQARMPKGVLKGVRTLTGNIVIEMGYAAGIHRSALIFTGLILFIFILFINIILAYLKRRVD